MGRQVKMSPQVSQRNTKNDIIQAYQDLLEQVNEGVAEDETSKQEKVVVDSAAQETVEKVTTDLSNLRISANQTISSLTEKLTSEAERLTTIQKAITIARKELEEINQIKTQAGMLKRMIEVQKQEEHQFEQDMATKRVSWIEEQKLYEEQLKKERTREEEEYTYQKNLRLKREKDMFEEEKRVWERDLQEKKKVQAQQETELIELRKKTEQFPLELDKAVKAAVMQAVGQEKKDDQIRQNFAKQEWDAKQQLSGAKITTLEQTVKAQAGEIEELKRQLEKANQQVKDIAVSFIEAAKKEKESLTAKPQTQNAA
ncbi:MAG: hypothetical protein ACREHC_01765 [Candidatus Levyibacteriota bacterium]